MSDRLEQPSRIAARSPAIVLVDPEIPPNTGNIGRTCVGLGLPLVLVGRLGFSLDSRELRRAGLDYWESLQLRVEPDADAFLERISGMRIAAFCPSGTDEPWDVDLCSFDYFCFGSESRGLPERWLAASTRVLRFPQADAIRSYNLASTVHSAAMEWARQAAHRDRSIG
jgi:tRNA (cytidine/uridine-2'-O-)-methyltransferase